MKNAPGVIGDFYSKVELSYVLSVISETAKVHIHALSVIRNAFAHSTSEMNLETAEVANLFRYFHRKIPHVVKRGQGPFGMRGELVWYIVEYYAMLTSYDPDGGQPIGP
jgi:hypothetical protein